MSRVYTDTIEPRKSTQDITLGTSGETISVGANSINVNTVADKGGNTLWTSDGSGNLSSVNAGLKGNLVLLATNIVTGGSSSAFTTLIDSTYDVYMFKFNAINPATDAVYFEWQGSTDGGSNYNVTWTTTYFYAAHAEDDSPAELAYAAGYDQAQTTNYQYLNDTLEDHSDACLAGELYLFDPASTTFVKNWYATTNAMFQYSPTGSGNVFTAGYFNTTSAINAISFKMSSGNMDGIIKMYGISST